MIDERTLKTELAMLLLTESGPVEHQVTHREGRIRGIVFALTGKDIGYGCGYRQHVSQICEWLGWGYKPYGSSGWFIDYHDEVNNDVLREAGIDLAEVE